jgi:hypothetical protein
MTLILALLCFYAGHILFKVLATRTKRKYLKTGDRCNVYLGERKIQGLVLKVNNYVDIWVIDRVIRYPRDQVYV